MSKDFQNLMKGKSDDELQVYIDKRSKFVPDAIEAAIKEMQDRGRVFPPEELEAYRHEFQLQLDAEQKKADEHLGFDKNVVTDEGAPVLYSERAIYVFTVLFSTIFGAVLLAINCKNIGSKKAAWDVILFGIGFAFLQGFVMSFFPRNSILSLVFSIVGAMILNHFFWKKYIGKGITYRVKPIWKPLIVGTVISIVVILGITYKLIEY